MKGGRLQKGQAKLAIREVKSNEILIPAILEVRPNEYYDEEVEGESY